MGKAPKKAKEPVRLRFKELADGNKSIYLDIYRNGKRSYEFLKLYLVPESAPMSKRLNADTMNAANAIKAQRIIELANSEAGLKNSGMSRMLLADWMNIYRQRKKGKSKGLQQQVGISATLLKEYGGERVRLKDVDKEFCSGFIHYLKNVYTTRTGSHLMPKTQRNYCIAFSSALNAAVKDGLIERNPFGMIDADDRIKVPESSRTYLTVEEVKTLLDTPCRNEAVKQAFMFSVFSGLRISDVRGLRWRDVERDGSRVGLSIVQKKTGEPLYIALNGNALKHLPDRGDASADDAVFHLPCHTAVNRAIEKWRVDAGIAKKVTYHTSRHTAATMLLTAGAELYTVSKILGHTEVRTTQIYAKIIDKKKDEAVSLVDKMFND